ncbi:MAG: adenylate/guanylate cyclase domain-containing protein [Roseibium sp.]
MAKSTQKDQRLKFRLTTIVGLGFGAFVAIAIGLVLALSVSANFSNTFSLLNDKTILSTQALESQLRTHFKSVENAVVGLQPLFEADTIALDDRTAIHDGLSIALKSNSDLTTLAVTDATGKRLGVYRSETGKIWRIASDAPPPGLEPKAVPKIEANSPPTWGPIVTHDIGLFANVSVPIVRDGSMVGVLTAASTMADIAEIVAAQDDGVDNTVFIMTGSGDVIMHSDAKDIMTGGNIAENLPGPWENIGDPVLSAMIEETPLEEFQRAADLGIDVSMIKTSHEEYILMKTQFAGFAVEPWTIGQYYRGATVSREVRRLAGSMFVGIGALIISVLIAFWLGRRVSRPLRNLAVQSQRVGTLSLNEVEPLPRSRVTEMDQVALAFNSMVVGLKAMNTYVPRSLFIKLMRLGGNEAAEPREAQLSILFTDIVGFTALSENMSAEETASLLNQHFAILVEAVESEGGTVDKFIGDGMLAFWGAPDARPDHAEAAIRTARKIAKALHEANLAAHEDGLPKLTLRIGIHSGPAVVGNVGALDRWNYTVVGDTVNAADRLQALGREVAGQPEVVILASAETVRQLPSEINMRQIGEHYLRGRTGRMEVFWIDPFPVQELLRHDTENAPVSAAE